MSGVGFLGLFIQPQIIVDPDLKFRSQNSLLELKLYRNTSRVLWINTITITDILLILSKEASSLKMTCHICRKTSQECPKKHVSGNSRV